MAAGGAAGGGKGGGAGARAGGGGSGSPRAPGGAPPGRAWADGLPPELLEKVARAVPAGDGLWFRLVCRKWAAAGAAVAAVPGEERLLRGKVTRTRGPDAAASAARVAEVMGSAMEEPLREMFRNNLCAYAAEGGHLAVLQWARSEGRPWDERTCAKAAMTGHLDILQWARANECPWNGKTCAAALMNGQSAVFLWARDNGCPRDEWFRLVWKPWMPGF